MVAHTMMRLGVLRPIIVLTSLGLPMQAAAGPVSVNATGGAAFAGEAINVALLEIRNDLTAHIAFAVAAGYLDVAGGGHDEAQLRLMAIGTWNVERWAIDNRHMLSLSTQSIERYRMRVRVARPELFGVPSLSARAFNEVFVDLGGAGFIRNNIALGVGLTLNHAVLAEIYRVWEGNHDAPNGHYVLGLVTVRF